MRASGLAVTVVIQLRAPATVGGRYNCRYIWFSCEVEGTLVVQQVEIAENVLLDFLGSGLRINFLQFADNFLHGVFAIATRNDFETGAIQAQGAFRHEEYALLVVFSEAAAGRETRMGQQIGRHA